MPAAADGRVRRGRARLRLRRRDAISRRMYQVPMPNTAKYTMTKAISEAATAGRRERRGRVARSAAGRRSCRAGGRPRWSSSRRSPRRSRPAPSPARSGAASASRRACRRSRASRLHTPSANIRKPSPTMMRNDQNTTPTGGRSSGGDGVEPGERRVEIVLEDQRATAAGSRSA